MHQRWRYVADSHHHRVVSWELGHKPADLACTLGEACTLDFEPGLLVNQDSCVRRGAKGFSFVPTRGFSLCVGPLEDVLRASCTPGEACTLG